ncbi:GNAT family N-acetyltransferase [Chitinophaga niabensis]|uniref:Protein N-acetyltransferase, RimJ/RimL family n=1 Tax=Chitinophaga niabensis TaxID=536979 RepID=A0A1N6K3G8_9BACT|nr:GNAT family N-acetyltransferase [Chitinophaga niabensis]SIO51128.1 Protein N-acetyltransferase, RimJ/RimL family [Chitinophaga niabensis]
METQVIKCSLEAIQPLRDLFLHESNFQFVCNKCHDFGWADTYLFTSDGVEIGYGAVWGTNKREDRDTIFEFYLLPTYRKSAHLVFPYFHAACGATLIECQTNDPLLTSMLYAFSSNIQAEAVLFEEDHTSTLTIPGVTFRKREEKDEMGDDDSTYVLERNGEIVASGGFVWSYNMPYIDIYMQVKEPYRQQGLGSLIVQELKKEAYLLKRVPAARCNISNHRSKATLLKAGFKVCGYRVKGTIQ